MSHPIADRPFDGHAAIVELQRATLEKRDAEIARLIAKNDWQNGRLSAIAAACSFDPKQDRDLETCVRRLYHEAQEKRA